MDSSAGDVFCPGGQLISGRKNPLLLISEALFFPYSFLFGFSFEFLYFIVQKTVIFI
jgi:hypothetical protein